MIWGKIEWIASWMNRLNWFKSFLRRFYIFEFKRVGEETYLLFRLSNFRSGIEPYVHETVEPKKINFLVVFKLVLLENLNYRPNLRKITENQLKTDLSSITENLMNIWMVLTLNMKQIQGNPLSKLIYFSIKLHDFSIIHPKKLFLSPNIWIIIGILYSQKN